jgi:hypothetical protein
LQSEFKLGSGNKIAGFALALSLGRARKQGATGELQDENQ